MTRRYDSDDDDRRDWERESVIDDDMRSVTRRVNESDAEYQRRLIDVRFNMRKMRGYV